MPLSSPLALKVTPVGRALPVLLKVNVAGNPEAVSWKLPFVPTVKLVLFALVIAGGWFTVRVKLCIALLPTPLLAVKVSG